MPTYVAPTYTAGFIGNICGATEWDAAMGDIEYLYDRGAFYSYTNTYYADPDTSEHDVFTFTLTGNSFGTTHRIIGRCRLLLSNDTTAARTVTIKIYYGSTALTMTSAALPTGASFTDIVADVDFEISAITASTQRVSARLAGDAPALASGAIRGSAYSAAFAEDSTIDKTIKVSITQNNAAIATKFLGGHAQYA